MRLKRITMQGFKSFADRVSIDFDSPVLVVVGPNGCGKSNIVDAFKWVMGEQRAKSLRGDKMLDVIFSGTTRRKPVNFAEVVLTFTDVEGELPTEYGEVEVCRRAYRNGDSEYFINRRPCRLKDIQSLFWDTGLGKDAYAIFEQGKIDQVINMSPLERRTIFEDAAGILRFKLRKKETLNKMDALEENLTRIRDVHRETSRSLRQLEKQSEQAQAYKEHKDEYSYLEKALLVEKWRYFHGQKAEVTKQLHQRSSDLEQILEEVKKEQEQFDGWRRVYEEKHRKLKAFETEMQKLSSETKIVEMELNNLKREQTEGEKREQRLMDAMKEIAEKRSFSREEFQEKKYDFEREEKEVNRSKNAWDEAKGGLKAKQEALEILRKDQKQWQAKHLQSLQAEVEKQRSIQDVKHRYESAKAQLERELKEKEELRVRSERIAQELKGIEEKWEELSANIAKERALLEKLDASLQNQRGKRKETEEKLSQVVHRASEVRGRLSALTRLKEGFEGVSKATKNLLHESQKPDSPIYGLLKPLYESISAKKGYEKPFSALLKHYAQTLVVETKAVRDTLLQFVEEQGLVDFSFICLEEIPRTKTNVESSFVRFVSEGSLAEHFAQTVSWRESVDELKDVSGPTVTSNGVLKDAYKVYTFPVGGREDTFLREAELQELQEELSKYQSQEQDLKDTVKALRAQEETLREERLSLDQEVRGFEMKSVEMNFSIQKLKADKESGKARQERLEKSIEERKQSIAKNEESFAALQQAYQEIRQETASFKQKLQHSEEELDRQAEDYQEHLEESQKLEQAYRKHFQHMQELGRFIEVFEARDQEQERLYVTREKEVLELQKKKVDLLQEIEKKQTEKNALQERYQSTQENQAGHAKLISLEKQQEVLFLKKQKELEGRIEKEKDSQRILELKEVEFQSKESALVEEIEHHLGVSIEDTEVRNIELTLSPEEAEARLKELKKWMDKAGAINMMAIEEHEQIQDKYRLVEEELDDLMKSKEELMQITKELDRQSRKLFRQTFKEIREHFKHNFAVLFGGGEADLTFDEEGDVLSAGIDIIVKPPGKAMRSIQLLSGGEKCLTALALLFAIFSVRPAPFCILDEIDAPLDDSNTKRFTELVKEYQEASQFVIVTHNKYTMTISDLLCGVSMEEKGVSKLMTLRMQGKEESKEPVVNMS